MKAVLEKAESLMKFGKELYDETLVAIGYEVGATYANTHPHTQGDAGFIPALAEPATNDKNDFAGQTESDIVPGFLKFTEMEILKMPKTFKKEFRADGCTAHVRKRKSGKDTWNYEIRYRKNGYNVQASAKTLEEAKRKFIERLKTAEPKNENGITVPKTFHDFAIYYFENFRKAKVTDATYRADTYRYNNYLKSHFKNIPLKNITPALCKSLLDFLVEKEITKTAQEIYSLMNIIFKGAIAHHLIDKNPMDIVPAITHEREHGTALTKAEEEKLLKAYAGSEFEILFAVALYTGLRPNEYSTAKRNGNFIIAVNSKRKHRKVEYKKIPISPMLAPYVEGKEIFVYPSDDIMRARLTKILPKRKLYDLRTTFYTRCKECGIAPAALAEFMGHSNGKLDEAYTDLSDKYLLKEGKKLKY